MSDPNELGAFDGMASPKRGGGKRSRNKGLPGRRKRQSGMLKNYASGSASLERMHTSDGSNAKSPDFGHRARNFMAAMWMRLSIYSGLRAVKLAPWRYGAKAEPKCPPRMPQKSDD